jgi:hypothetical protein
MAEDESKPRRFARAVAMLRHQVESLRGGAERCEAVVRRAGMDGAHAERWQGYVAQYLADATECEAAADLLEAAESKEP